MSHFDAFLHVQCQHFQLKMAVEYEIVLLIAVNSKCTNGIMSLHDMSVFAGGRRVNLNLFAACIVASSSVETP